MCKWGMMYGRCDNNNSSNNSNDDGDDNEDDDDIEDNGASATAADNDENNINNKSIAFIIISIVIIIIIIIIVITKMVMTMEGTIPDHIDFIHRLKPLTVERERKPEYLYSPHQSVSVCQMFSLNQLHVECSH